MFTKLFLFALVASVSAFNPGATFSIDLNTLREAKNVYFQYILGVINKVQLPDIGFHNGHIDQNSFQISDTSGDFTFSNIGNNSVQIDIINLGASFHSNSIAYKVWFYDVTGSLDVSINDIALSIQLQVGEQLLSNNRSVPSFKILNSTIQIPTDDVSIALHGDAVIEFVSLFEGIFKSVVANTIMEEVNKITQTQLGPELSNITASTNGETDLWEDISLDWSMVSAPQLNDYDFSLGVRGLFYPNGSTPIEPNATAPVMPYRDNLNEDKVQVFLSTYTMNSLAYTFLNTTGFSLLITNDILPPTVPIQLNTKFLDVFLPGLAAKYGNDSLVDLRLNLTSLNNIDIKEQNETLSCHVDLAMEFLVHQQEFDQNYTVAAVVLDIHDIFGKFHIGLQDMNATITIDEASQSGITVRYSKIGNLTDAISEIQQLVSQILTQALPPINQLLEKAPIVIPNLLFGLFELTDVKIAYHDDYLAAGLTPHFRPFNTTVSQQDSIFTQSGSYRYVQFLDQGKSFSMWDTMLNQVIGDVRSVKEIEEAVLFTI